MAFQVGKTSYVILAAADKYFEERDISAWIASPLIARQSALMFATVYLDGAYEFEGEKKSDNQPLEWPRTGVKDGNGNPVKGFPGKIEQACCELALVRLNEAFSENPNAYPFVDLLLSGLIKQSGSKIIDGLEDALKDAQSRNRVMEQRERVANAIRTEGHNRGFIPWDQLDNLSRSIYLAQADAAIEATGVKEMETALRNILPVAKRVNLALFTEETEVHVQAWLDAGDALIAEIEGE